VSAITTTQFSVDGTAVLIAESNGTPLEVHLHSSGAIYVGNSNVTSSTGLRLDSNDKITFTIPDNTSLYAIAGSGTQTLYVMAIKL
jgi:hypothetical protein